MGLPVRRARRSRSRTRSTPARPRSRSPRARQLLVAAAEEDLRQADQALTLERRLLFAAPALALGWEQRDPDRRRARHPADRRPRRFRSRCSTRIAARSCSPRRSATARAGRAVAGTTDPGRAAGGAARGASSRWRATGSRAASSSWPSANRVAQLSLLAYREGASALTNVLEAQRIARETLAQYVDDVAAVRNAAGVVRLLTLTAHRNDQ